MITSASPPLPPLLAVVSVVDALSSSFSSRVCGVFDPSLRWCLLICCEIWKSEETKGVIDYKIMQKKKIFIFSYKSQIGGGGMI